MPQNRKAVPTVTSSGKPLLSQKSTQIQYILKPSM